MSQNIILLWAITLLFKHIKTIFSFPAVKTKQNKKSCRHLVCLQITLSKIWPHILFQSYVSPPSTLTCDLVGWATYCSQSILGCLLQFSSAWNDFSFFYKSCKCLLRDPSWNSHRPLLQSLESGGPAGVATIRNKLFFVLFSFGFLRDKLIIVLENRS